MPNFKSILLLSPHSDDIALSLGGWLAFIQNNSPELLKSMEVFTGFICSQSLPHMQSIEGNSSKATALRSKEDQRFCDRFGITLSFGMLPDTSILNIDICEPIDLNSDQRFTLVKKMLRNRLKGKTIFSPLSIGDHIDHRIFARAVIEAKEQTSLSVFYEDLPYANWYDDETRDALIKSKLGSHAVAFQCKLTKEHRKTKRAGLECYPSQLNLKEINDVLAYQHLDYGLSSERVWAINPSPIQIRKLQSFGFLAAIPSP